LTPQQQSEALLIIVAGNLEEGHSSSFSLFFWTLSLSLPWINTIAVGPGLPIPQCPAVGLAIIQGRT